MLLVGGDQVMALQSANAPLREEVENLRQDNVILSLHKFPLLPEDKKQEHQHATRAWALKRVTEDDLSKADRTLQTYINLSAKQEERYWSLSCLLDAERAAPEQVSLLRR